MLKPFSGKAKIDRGLLTAVILLGFFGILMVFDSSSVMAAQNFNDKFHFVKLHGVWAFLGMIIMLLASLIDFRFWKKTAVIFFAASLASLVLVLIPGIGLKFLGGRRWLGIGELTFQPSEVAKLATIIYLASFLEKKKSFFHFSIILAVVAGLLMLEPDLGTTVILIFSSLVVYFLSGASLKEFFFLALAGIAAGSLLILISPYRMARMKVFLNPDLDPQGSSYHLRQILLALGSGGFFGRGIGQSRQKFLFLPETATDSIFAVIAEETGFAGAFLVLGCFFYIISRSLRISRFSTDKFGQLLAGGITGLFFIQAFLNLGSMVSLVPLTGVPLPLISYGRSSMVVTFFYFGILLNISRNVLIVKKEKTR